MRKSYIPSKVVIVIKGVVAHCLNFEVLGSLVFDASQLES